MKTLNNVIWFHVSVLWLETDNDIIPLSRSKNKIISLVTIELQRRLYKDDMNRDKKDRRRHKLFSKLDNDPNAMKTKAKTLFKRGHWEGALKCLDRYSF